jgi:putative FmdB family regulatory protein
MPLYEYECDACGSRFEQIQKFSDPPLEVCVKCGEKKIHKLVSSPAIQFKGSGWYINDYAKKGAGTDPKASASQDTKDKKDSKDTKDTKSSPSDSGTTASSSGSTDTVSATPSSKDS